MSILDLVGITSGIVTVLAFIYMVLVGQEPITKILPTILSHPKASQIAKSILAIGITTFVFIFIIFPTSIVVELVDVGSNTLVNETTRQQSEVILRYEPDQNEYVQADLLSADVLLTALTIEATREKKTFFVGSYGEGIFMTDSFPVWKSIGLDNLAVTQVHTFGWPTRIVAATNIGVFITEDYGNTWRNTGPLEDLVTALSINPYQESTMLAGTLNGLYKSIDSGNTWIGPFLDDQAITSLMFAETKEDRVYASALPGTVFKSEDGGETWTVIWQDNNNRGFTPIAVDSRSPEVIYIGPSDLGLFRSTDAGNSWVHLGLQGVSISSIIVSDELEGLVFVGSDNGHGVFTSLNGGESWQNYGVLRDQIISMEEDENNPGSLIVTALESGLVTTGDFGRTWLSMGLHSASTSLTGAMRDLTVIDDPDHLLAISVVGLGMLESVDGGETWFRPSQLDEYRDVGFRRIIVNRTNSEHILLSGQRGVLIESMDRGKSWRNISSNLPREGYAPVALAKDGTMYSGPGSRGVWKKSSLQEEWIPLGLGTFSIQDIWTNSNGSVIYAFDETGGFHISEDFGNTWVTASFRFQSVTVLPDNNNLIIGISEENEVLRSIDTGQSWETIMTILPSAGAFPPGITTSPDQPPVYFLTSEKVLKISYDDGNHWEDLNLPDVGSLRAFEAGILYFSNGTDSLYRSSDFGQSWTAIQDNTTLATFNQVISLGKEKLLASSLPHGLLISNNSGETWKSTSLAVCRRSPMLHR